MAALAPAPAPGLSASAALRLRAAELSLTGAAILPPARCRQKDASASTRHSRGMAFGMGCAFAAQACWAERARRPRTARYCRRHAKCIQEIKDSYVQLSVVHAQSVGDHGIILQFRRADEQEAQPSLSGIPMEFPIILNAQQADNFLRAARELPRLSPIIGCRPANRPRVEVRILNVHCNGPDGITGEVVVEEEDPFCPDRMISNLNHLPAHEGVAFGLASNLSMPVAISVRALLHCSAASADRLRLENLMSENFTGEVIEELQHLSEQCKAAAEEEDLPTGSAAELLLKLEWLAAQWRQHAS